ncbi:MAG: hypothetical protein WC712_04525, partial [Candidatus Brocadiia bacterium]
MDKVKSNFLFLAVLFGILVGIVITAKLNIQDSSKAEDANKALQSSQDDLKTPEEALRMAKAFSDASAWVAAKAMPAVVSVNVIIRQRGAPIYDLFRGRYIIP